MDQMAQSEGQPGYLQFPVKLSLEDMIAYNRLCCKGQRSTWLMYYLLFIGCAFFVGMISCALHIGSNLDIAAFWLNLLGTLALYILVARFYSRIYYRTLWPESSHVRAEKMMTFSIDGLYTENKDSAGVVRWPLIKNIIRGKTAFYLMLDSRQGYVVPYKALPAGLTPDQFEQDLKIFRENFRE
jgi:hypothetical protein